ncbi:MAG: PorT family protein [Hymenobacter sp.]|nr:MAG: PorT family protein [Hymenobacter sp.]
MKGAKSEQSASLGGVTYSDKVTARLHYIDVPVLARVNAGGLFFELGPQVGFLVAANRKEEISGGIGAGTYNDDVKSDLKSVDFGYAAGLGYQLSNGPGIGLRYNGGFSDTNKESGSSAVRNSAFQLYVSFMFGGK